MHFCSNAYHHSRNPSPQLAEIFERFRFLKGLLLILVQAADATCSLAGIWLAMGPSHGQQAAQQLRSVLPTVLGNADTDLQARVQLVLAQALLAAASPADLKADPEE